MQLEDQDILALFFQKGKEEIAFKHLINKYKKRVYWHIRKMVINHEDTDDLTQNTFVKVWKGLSKFNNKSSLFTWIYRIATNETLNFLKANQKKVTQSIEDVQVESKAESYFFTGDEMEAKLYKAINTLPEKQRLVFNMKYFEEIKFKEMAEVLGGTTGSLKASYHHAKKKIEYFLIHHD